MPLGHLKHNSFTFNPTEAYLVLLISRSSSLTDECKFFYINKHIDDFAMKDFPPVLW